MTKTIYNFHPQTGEFINEAPADQSPREPGVYLTPANATDMPPPQHGGRQAAVFASGAWSLVPDWRTVDLYKTADGSVVSITQLGQTPADVGATEQARPSPAHAWGGGAWVLDVALQAELQAQAQAALIKQYEDALDTHLDAVAKQHRYDSRFTFALRAGYPGPYHAEGVAYAQWMDACNVRSFALMRQVLAGQAQMPTLAAFIDALPPFVPPVAEGQ